MLQKLTYYLFRNYVRHTGYQRLVRMINRHMSRNVAYISPA